MSWSSIGQALGGAIGGPGGAALGGLVGWGAEKAYDNRFSVSENLDPYNPSDVPSFSGFTNNDVGDISNVLTSAGQYYMADKVNKENVKNTESGQVYNAAEALKAREFNAEQAKINREFQERMSGSAYQRAVGDMRKAGINPMLAFSQGGASSPSGSAASGSGASSGAYQGYVNPVAGALSTAYQGSQIRNIEADTSNKYATNPLLEASTGEKLASAGNLEANTKVAVKRLEEIREHIRLMFAQGGEAESRIPLNNAQTALLGVTKSLQSGQITLNQAHEAVERVRKRLMEYQTAEAEAQSKFWKSDLGEASPSIQLLIRMLGAIFKP